MLDSVDDENLVDYDYLLKCVSTAIKENDISFLNNVVIKHIYRREDMEWFRTASDTAIKDKNHDISFLNSAKTKRLFIYRNIIIELINHGYYSIVMLSDYDMHEDIKDVWRKKILSAPLSIFYKYGMRYNDKNEFFNLCIKEKEFDKAALLLDSTQQIIYELNSGKKVDENLLELIAEGVKSNFAFAVKIFDTLDISFLIREKRILNAMLESNIDFINEYILSYLEHEENEIDKVYNDDIFNCLKNYFIKKYNLNGNHLLIMKEKYGPLITKYLRFQNLQQIINLDDEKFNKFINLFSNKEKYTINDLEAIYDSFKQEEFAINNPQIKNIFANIMHAIEDKSSEINNLLMELNTIWSDKLQKKIFEKYNEEILSIDYVYNKILNTNDIEYEHYVNILHFITDNYIALKREEYRKNYNMYEEAKVPFVYDERDWKKAIILRTLTYCLIYNKMNVSNSLMDGFYKKIVNELITKCEGMTEEKANKLLLLVCGLNIKYEEPNIENVESEFEDLNQDTKLKEYLKQNIGILMKVCNQNIALIPEEISKEKNIAECYFKGARKKYYLEDQSNIYRIFSNIRIDLISNTILEDENIDMYNCLSKIIKKYKLDRLVSSVDNLLKIESLELECGINDISAFLSFFSDIYIGEKDRLASQDKDISSSLISIINIFKYMDEYSAVSSIYSQILGMEDSGLIRRDPSPNSSDGYSKEDRLKYAVEKTFKNFKKEYVNVPTFISEFSLGNGKVISATVGNFTSPTNLTHGERTGACMRIGGVGFSLFDSEDIFHIEFNEPKTGKYISRVTGFRNGNTVFLNELRCSCDKGLYNDLEIVNACKQVADKMIELSKNSTCPIENVVVHRDYAMLAVDDDRVKLNISDNKKGINQFYSDVTTYVHVLSTTAQYGFTPVNLDNSNVPKYKPAREKIKGGNDKKIIGQINRIYTINKGLQGQDFYVNPLLTKIIYGFVGEDWYVCIDENNEIISERIDRDDRSIKEFEYAKEEIMKYVQKEEVQYAI